MRIVFGIGLAVLLPTGVEAVALTTQVDQILAQVSAEQAGTQSAPTINIIDNNRNMSTGGGGGGGFPFNMGGKMAQTGEQNMAQQQFGPQMGMGFAQQGMPMMPMGMPMPQWGPMGMPMQSFAQMMPGYGAPAMYPYMPGYAPAPMMRPGFFAQTEAESETREFQDDTLAKN